MNFYKIEEFLEEIVSHVKFVFDRDEIKLELRDHMMDKLQYYMESGYDEEGAEELTIKDMGDPKEIGLELDKAINLSYGLQGENYNYYGIVNDERIKKLEILLDNGEILTETKFYEDMFILVDTGPNNKFPYVVSVKGYDLEDNVIFEEKY